MLLTIVFNKKKEKYSNDFCCRKLTLKGKFWHFLVEMFHFFSFRSLKMRETKEQEEKKPKYFAP